MSTDESRKPAQVIDLASKRAALSAADDDTFTCPCGEAWFTLDGSAHGLPTGAVCLRSDQTIKAYSGVPRCISCGQLAWPQPSLGR